MATLISITLLLLVVVCGRVHTILWEENEGVASAGTTTSCHSCLRHCKLGGAHRERLVLRLLLTDRNILATRSVCRRLYRRKTRVGFSAICHVLRGFARGKLARGDFLTSTHGCNFILRTLKRHRHLVYLHYRQVIRMSRYPVTSFRRRLTSGARFTVMKRGLR